MGGERREETVEGQGEQRRRKRQARVKKEGEGGEITSSNSEGHRERGGRRRGEGRASKWGRKRKPLEPVPKSSAWLNSPNL